MGRNLVADIMNFPDVTQHTDVYARALLFALAWHALDDAYTGSASHKKLMQTAYLKPMTFYRALREIECSEEVQFYDDPGKPCYYFLRWMWERHEEREAGKPPAVLKWPEEFIRLGRKCPRPGRLVWTPDDRKGMTTIIALNKHRREARQKRRQG